MRKLLLGLGFLSLAACKKEIDTTAPVLKLLETNPLVETAEICGQQESNVTTVYTGDTIVWKTRMTDNEGLSQYKVDIHENFDCHGHRSPVTTAWNLQRITNITGTSLDESIEVIVPENARAGNYHYHIRLLDDSGNEGEVTYYSVKVKSRQDSTPPTLKLTNTPLNPTIKKGEQLRLQGSLSDNQSLEGGQLELVYFSTSSNRQVAVEQDITTNTTNKTFSIDYTIPNTLVDGKYDFYLYGYDAVGNVSAKVALEVTID